MKAKPSSNQHIIFFCLFFIMGIIRSIETASHRHNNNDVSNCPQSCYFVIYEGTKQCVCPVDPTDLHATSTAAATSHTAAFDNVQPTLRLPATNTVATTKEAAMQSVMKREECAPDCPFNGAYCDCQYPPTVPDVTMPLTDCFQGCDDPYDFVNGTLSYLRCNCYTFADFCPSDCSSYAFGQEMLYCWCTYPRTTTTTTTTTLPSNCPAGCVLTYVSYTKTQCNCNPTAKPGYFDDTEFGYQTVSPNVPAAIAIGVCVGGFAVIFIVIVITIAIVYNVRYRRRLRQQLQARLTSRRMGDAGMTTAQPRPARNDLGPVVGSDLPTDVNIHSSMTPSYVYSPSPLAPPPLYDNVFKEPVQPPPYSAVTPRTVAAATATSANVPPPAYDDEGGFGYDNLGANV